MRQTVAVGVIKATTPKIVEGKATKAAQKADKKVSCVSLLSSHLSCHRENSES